MFKIIKSRFFYLNRRFWRHFLPVCALIVLFTAISLIPQENDYWSNAPVGRTKIFTISFSSKQIGIAKSAEGEVLLTSDGGLNWKTDLANISPEPSINSEIHWKADIYCAIMKTTDGGSSWMPYEEGKQEHFCGVYLKDDNTGYKIASEFLNKVTMEINYCFMNNKLDSLLNHPQQCTEYYKSPEEGWALGWCVRNFNK